MKHLLVLKVEKLERQLWSPKSERYVPDILCRAFPVLIRLE